ncbi:MAG: histidine triad nucleotide-binding protein [Clostridiales bacterium]|jgi:histidine triad (HIT) family protein|nr:histidine triad nucleotide-binding protein [Clostridiales bacterium]
MKDPNCIFCKIAAGEIPSQKLYEDDKFFVIRDINPKKKIHLLLIPKEHYADITSLTESTASDLGTILKTLKEIAPILGIEDGFRLVVNRGALAGQTVFHLHIHVLGGEEMTDF